MRFLMVAPALVLALAIPAAARTWTILPDATGDAPTIQAGVDSASAGDTILLADGVFTGVGNRGVAVGEFISIRSESLDPLTCVVDCEGADRAFSFSSAQTPICTLEGITVTGGFVGDGGGAIAGSPGMIRRCRFVDNQARDGGAIDLGAGSMDVVDCYFENNEAQDFGGAVYGLLSFVDFVDCVFSGNTGGIGGACLVSVGAVTATRCSFLRNKSPDAALMRMGDGSMTITGCIFYDNSSYALLCERDTAIVSCTFVENRSGILGLYAALDLENTIVAFSDSGPPIECVESTVAISCCDVIANAGGDWVDCLAGHEGVNGNFSADPLFCDPESGTFTIQSDSPCAPPAATGCGLVGALPVGCGPVALENVRWGAIKNRFR